MGSMIILIKMYGKFFKKWTDGKIFNNSCWMTYVYTTDGFPNLK